MNRLIAFLFCLHVLLMPSTSHAGFITGYLVGSASNNSKVSSSSGPIQGVPEGTQMTDVLICLQNYSQELAYGCAYGNKVVTPEEYVKSSGYSKLHSIGAILSDGSIFIVMYATK